MQYTIRGIPAELDRTIRERARADRKSLNEIAIEALAEGLGFGDGMMKRRDLSDIAGTWEKDPLFEKALRDQDRIEKELWK